MKEFLEMSKVNIRRLDSTTKNDTTATSLINSNFSNLQEAIENTLSRDGTTPNFMNANLDMNSYRIINLGEAVEDGDPVTLGQLNERIGEDIEKAGEFAEIAKEAARVAEVSSAAASSSASRAAYYAEGVKFGMQRELIRVSDWQQSYGNYVIFFPDEGIINAVYKKVSDDKFVKIECDIETTENGVTIHSITPFDGYALAVNSVNAQFIHTQDLASATWTIEHNLGEYPAVTAIDDNGYVMVATVQYIDLNTVELTFTEAVAGKAILN